ncbi:MAG: high-potential iron-sulfur protein [Salinibacter sp.]
MSTESSDRVSRRRFLQSVGVAGVVGAGSTLLAACGGSDDSGGSSSGSSSSGDGSASASASCSDLSSLSDAEKKQRSQMVKSLQYVEESPQDNKNCANCSLYIKSEYGEGCGGCQLFPGPVAAKGYCNSWAPAT